MLVASTAVLTFGGLPLAAHAAAATVNTETELITQLGTAGVDPITIGTTMSANTANSLVVPRSVTIDLAGHTLFTKNVHLDSGVTLTIVNSSPGSGALFANSDTTNLAGITTTGASLIVRASVKAFGGPSAVGIGGDNVAHGDGGAVVIDTGATVTAGASSTVSAIGASYAGTSFGTFEVNGSFIL